MQRACVCVCLFVCVCCIQYHINLCRFLACTQWLPDINVQCPLSISFVYMCVEFKGIVRIFLSGVESTVGVIIIQ